MPFQLNPYAKSFVPQSPPLLPKELIPSFILDDNIDLYFTWGKIKQPTVRPWNHPRKN